MEPLPRTIKTLIVEDRPRTRQALRALLSTEPTVVVVGESADGAEAIRLIETLHPDLVLMDIAMPGLDGLAATRLIKERWPATRVIALTMYPHYQQMARDAGADLVLSKGDPPERLLAIIRDQASPSV
jgi:DNA-binding NarL/FixJ family response regulator